MSDFTAQVTVERLAYLTLAKQLATPSFDGSFRPATFVTENGSLKGEFAGLSTDERSLRVANLETAVGTYRQASLRDTDVLVARFELDQAEIAEIRSVRDGVVRGALTREEGTAADSINAPSPVSINVPVHSRDVPAVTNSETNKTSAGGLSSGAHDDDDDDDSDGCDAIGFMFDAEQSKSERKFTFVRGGKGAADNDNDGDDSGHLHIRLLCIDDDPGAVQSGHYIWPAATSLADHLATHWTEIVEETRVTGDGSDSFKVIELGAGCGLAGIAAACLATTTMKKTVETTMKTVVLFTDHDPKTLELIRENLELQDFKSTTTLDGSAAKVNGGGGEVDDSSSSSSSSSSSNLLHLLACDLKWGESHHSAWPRQLVEVMTADGGSGGRGSGEGFDLVLCSDVIYDEGVVEPLLWTISRLLKKPVDKGEASKKKGSRCLLCASFKLEDGTDELIEQICVRFGLSCTLLFDQLGVVPGGCRLHAISLVENEN